MTDITQESHDTAMLSLRGELSEAINLKQSEINDLKTRLEELAKSSSDQAIQLQDELRDLRNKHQALIDEYAQAEKRHQQELVSKDAQLVSELEARNALHQQNAQQIVDQANAVCNTLKQSLQATQDEAAKWKALYDASRQVIAAHEACAPAELRAAMSDHQRMLDEQLIMQLQARMSNG